GCLATVSVRLPFVVPKVVAVFETSKAKLPVITRLLISTSGFFRAYGLYLLIGAVAAYLLFRRWQRDPAARRRFQRLQLRAPLLGKLTRGFNTARFTRTFSILTASSVPELDAILSALVGLLGPVLIIFMGLFVMGIVFAMLLPIFEMNNLIH